MENKELTKKYELMVIVDAKLPSEEKDAIFKEVVEVVNTSGGKVINNQVWEEKRKLTFDIKKKDEGTFYLVNFESKASNIVKMHNIFRLNEKILRFAIMAV